MKLRHILPGLRQRVLTRVGIQPLLDLKREYLTPTGWLVSSRRREPVDSEGKPIPWITYASLAFLASRVRPDMTVFEYGSGASTLWWSERVRHVVSCEHDPAWFERMRPLYRSNVLAVHVPLEYGGAYCREALRHRQAFDIVVIDGRDRVNCASHCVGALSSLGVVLWDNTDREEYHEGLTLLEGQGFRRLEFWGMGPIVPYAWCTSIFYRADNCLGI